MEYNPVEIQEKRNALLDTLAVALGEFCKETYLALDPDFKRISRLWVCEH